MPYAFGSTLDELSNSSGAFTQVKRKDLSPGDCIVVRTAKSVYRLRALSDGKFTVSGGWFDRKGLSPVAMSVSGCTWGGSAIMPGIVAACGLRIEFGNRLTTSPVRRVFVIPLALLN